MIYRRIKNEQWYIKQLISKIDCGDISKPKFQRKRKWDILPTKDNNANEQSYIKFLFDTVNSVHAITFGQDNNSGKLCFSNIDGNNRINAIKHFMNKPFEIFHNYLDELINFINDIDTLSKSEVSELHHIFRNLSYNQIINFKYNKYFIESNYIDLYNNKLKIYRDEFEPYIENIQKKLKINGTENFDTSVQINLNLFEGYNTDELCKIFEDINKFNSKLTETELLACRLFNECNFIINDSAFKTEIQHYIKDYYIAKADNEVLDCYIYNPQRDRINAHDLIVSFQNLCSTKFNFIDKTDVDGLPLFFKIYKSLYGSLINTFTTQNINDFIDKIKYSCEIFKEVISVMFTDKISDKLFNNTCQKKIETLKKNNLYVIICCIIGYFNKNTDRQKIKRELEKCVIFHFMISDIKDKDIRGTFMKQDSITYRTGGGVIDAAAKSILSNPENISNKITEKLFNSLIEYLFSENNNPHERYNDVEKKSEKKSKRRLVKFYEKTLMFYYYKQKIPTNMLDNEFSIEHICPNSSEWEGELDKDRPGNLIPIIVGINSSRGNRHITNYNDTSGFCTFIKDIIPAYDVYDSIMLHNNRTAIIINNHEYNNMCIKTENIYKKNFIACIFN